MTEIQAVFNIQPDVKCDPMLKIIQTDDSALGHCRQVLKFSLEFQQHGWFSGWLEPNIEFGFNDFWL